MAGNRSSAETGLGQLAFGDSVGIADAESLKAQRRYLWLLKVELLGLLGAVAMPVAALLRPLAEHSLKYFAIASAGSILLTLTASFVNRWFQLQGLWYSARALAESLKSESWRFAMRAGDYMGQDAQAGFVGTVQSLMLTETIKRRLPLLNGVTSENLVTAAMTRLRSVAPAARLAFYVEHRLTDQHAWYLDKALSNRHAETAWFTAAIGAQLAAFGCAMWTILEKGPVEVVSFAATAATSAVAWANSKDFSFHAQSYANIAGELGRLLEESKEVKSDEELARLVDNVEHSISREHTIWVARKR